MQLPVSYKVPIVLNRTETGTFFLFITCLTFIIPSKALRVSDRSSQSLASCSDLQAHIKFTAEHQQALFQKCSCALGLYFFTLPLPTLHYWLTLYLKISVKVVLSSSSGKGKLSKYYLPDINSHFKEDFWRPCITFPLPGFLFPSPLHQS